MPICGLGGKNKQGAVPRTAFSITVLFSYSAGSPEPLQMLVTENIISGSQGSLPSPLNLAAFVFTILI